MMLTNSSVHVVEEAPKMPTCLRPQDELPLPVASLGDSPQLEGRSDQALFKFLL